MYRLFNYFFNKTHYQDTFFYGYLYIYGGITFITLLVDIWIGNRFNQLLQIIILVTILSLYFLFKDKKYRTLFSIFLAWFSALIIFVLVIKNDFEHNIYYVLIFMSFHFFVLLRELVLIVNLLFYTLAMMALLYWGYEYSDNRLFFDDNIALLIFAELASFILVSGVFVHYFITYTLQKLEQSNAQKEVLLQEVHHRVKNNLNMMSSILALQSDSDDPQIKELLESNRRRIESVGMVHELLYKSEDLEKIDFSVYIDRLAHHLIHACAKYDIQLHIETHDIVLSLDTMSHLGLILQELLSNSMKHAFSGSGSIYISLEEEEGEYLLSYQDSGKNQEIAQKSEESLGMELIELKVLQLGGTLSLDKKHGFAYSIRFKDEEQ